jgi:peptidyl-prolyl cis-trans isomerase A (cyclophilin A)
MVMRLLFIRSLILCSVLFTALAAVAPAVAQAGSTPNAFSFTAQSGVALTALITSNPITVSGINTSVAIGIAGGQYSLNGGAYTAASGVANNGDSVTVQLTSSGLYGQAASATLTIGGVAGVFSATTTNNPTGTIVRMQTSLGPIDIALFDHAAPLNVANFLSYVNSGAYSNSFIHRSAPGFVIQGGGYTWDNASGSVAWSGTTPSPNTIPANTPITNEYSPTRPNVRGTVAMALLSGYPNSATTEWFINLADNTSASAQANLDTQNGGFTVFGQVLGNGMIVADAIAAQNYYDLSKSSVSPVWEDGAFDALPLVGGTGGNYSLIMVNNVSALTPTTSITLASGWNLLGNGSNAQLPVASTFGDPAISSVWKWEPTPAPGLWAFYSPALPNSGQDYAASKGYDILTTINAGEGYWVNVNPNATFTASLPTGTPLTASAFADQTAPLNNNLHSGWSLIATGDQLMPSDFLIAIGAGTLTQGVIPTSLTSLWAWDSATSKWYFYAPGMDNAGALTGYITSKGYEDFTAKNKTLDPTTGFWVNHP